LEYRKTQKPVLVKI